MEDQLRSELTRDLESAAGGDVTARTRFWERGYDELHRIAAGWVARFAHNVSLSPADLVGDVFARMVDRARVSEEGTRFFRACFATECRRVLVDHVRRRGADKRGGDRGRVTLHSEVAAANGTPIDLLDFHAAFERLEQIDDRAAKVVELRVFGGLSIVEIARELRVSESTVEKEWRHARMQLHEFLES